VSGESWSADAEVPAPTQGAVAVIGISALKPDGHVDESSETFVSGLSSKRSLFLTDDKTLLVIRTNGNADRIGNVYRAGGGIEGRALSAFIFGCRFNNAEQRDLAFEYMRGRRFQKWATSLVAGSTGLKNLPIRELRKIPIPVATSPDVLSQLQRLRAVRNLEEATERVIQTSRQSIAALRENLLGGVHVQ
jgi:type I restriction enzyme S subunit